MTGSVRERILELASDGPILGTAQLTEDIPCSDKKWVVRILRNLQDRGLITYLPTSGGAGHRSLIRKVNRNSPGYPRRTR